VTPTLYVYSRRGCHLCDVLVEALLPLVRGRLAVEVRDIDSRDDWRERYDVQVPVVEFDGEVVCRYRLDRPSIEALLAKLGGTGDGQ
jgi:glutaredoxin